MAAPTVIGRDPERQALSSYLNEALAGRGSLVLIGGELGVGKTTIAGWLAEVATAAGALVLAGSSYDLTTTPPYGPWTEIVDAWPRTPDLPRPPDALQAEQTADAVRSQHELFQLLAECFATASAVQPLVLVLEDIHWADHASLDLLRHLARGAANQRLLLVATYRDEEITRGHPLHDRLPVLARETTAHRLLLRRLDAAGIGEIISSRFSLTGADHERLTSYVHQLSDGNPFFADEILRALQDSGVLTQAGAQWNVGVLDRSQIPPLARQIIDGRIARLGEPSRRLLELAAVIGHEGEIDLWAEIADDDDQVLAATLEQAIDARLLEEVANGTRFRFCHALVRETLYVAIVGLRRRAWHRAIAEALDARGTASADQIAHHYRQAADPRAASWLIAAGDYSIRTYAWPTAAERFSAAIEFVRQPEERALLLYRIGRLRRFTDPQQTLHDLSTAAEVARATSDQTLVAYATADLGVALGYTGQFRAGLERLELGTNLISALPADHLWARPGLLDCLSDTLIGSPVSGAGYVHTRLGTFVSWLAAAGHLDRAIRLGEPFIRAADTAGTLNIVSDDSLLDALLGVGNAYACLGRPADAARIYDRLQRHYEQRGFLVALYIAVSERLRIVTLQYNADDPAVRRRLAALMESIRERAGESLVLDELLPLLFIDGDWQAARALADSIVQETERTNATLQLDFVGRLAHHQGDPDRAWAQVTRLFAAGPATDPGDTMFYTAVPLAELAADLCLDAGDLPAARRWIDTHRRYLDWSGARLWRADHELLEARFDQSSGNLDDAIDHARSAVGLASEPALPLARGAAERRLGELLAERGRATDAERHLGSALALADTCAAPFERALTLLALGQLRAAQGNGAVAGEHAEEALAICATLDARPAMRRAEDLLGRLTAGPRRATYPAGLTAREVDVLRLIAQGLIDADVAERLFMARRTVNTHLTSIYTKLGVNSRAAATRFAVEHGLT